MILKHFYFQTRLRIRNQTDSFAKNNQKKKKAKNKDQ